jgi:predicted anti-sigma-YlaC factor YlaD
MASITHLKAQNLLQAAADSTLAPLDEKSLNVHLEECEECRQYARHLSKLQDDLRRVTRYRWNLVSPQLSANEIRNRSTKVKAQAYKLRTVGTFSVAMALLALVFILTINISSTMRSTPATISGLSLTPEESALTPTPSIIGTVANTTVQECSDIAYVVQENDTLESIAARHSVSKETIRQHNGLATNNLTVNMVLVIPLCEGTPANSTMTPTTTTTTTATP